MKRYLFLIFATMSFLPGAYAIDVLIDRETSPKIEISRHSVNGRQTYHLRIDRSFFNIGVDSNRAVNTIEVIQAAVKNAEVADLRFVRLQINDSSSEIKFTYGNDPAQLLMPQQDLVRQIETTINSRCQ